MKKITLLLLLILGIFVAEGYAQEAEQAPSPESEQTESAEPEAYVFPVIKPEISLTGGYRFVHLNGSNKAEEFEYLHNSIYLGGELRTISINHRLHLDLEMKNEKDYYGDISYAYKDLVLFRGVNATLFHNLDNITLFTFDEPGFTARNASRFDSAAENYGIKVGISNLFMRFKAPNYPAHLYFEGNFVDKDGTAQQMFYINTPSTRISEKRKIDLQTSVYTVGANSHLGPVEADLSHSEKRLEVGADKALIDTDRRDGFTGKYYHNRISELESSTNTLKLHTSYTGRLVASATLSKTDKENRDSHAKADYLFATGEVTWMPMTALTFFVKYRHQERDVDNPDTVTVKDITGAKINTYTGIRNSISSISDSVSGTVRYRPLKGVLLKADYAYEEIRRDNAEEWHVIPDSTQRHKFSLSGDARILSGLKLNLKYTHKDINNPAYNTEPDKSDEGTMTLSWMPFSGLNTYVSYGIREEKRKSLQFFEGESAFPDNRKAKYNRLIGTVSYVLLKNLSLTASYAYMHDKVQQDILYNITQPPTAVVPAKDPFVPYKTTSRNYSFDVNYSPKSFISLNGGISHTVSQGTFYPTNTLLAQPSIASFSELKIRETSYSASGEYRFKGDFSAGIQYRYSTFKDVADNIYDDVNDGRASIILLTLSKKW